MTSTIPLSKNYNPAKLEFPVYASVKYDGVPAKIYVRHHPSIGWQVNAVTRQGNPMPSVEALEFSIENWAGKNLRNDQYAIIVGEVMQENLFADFKDTSGIVRRQHAQDGLRLMVFDFVVQADLSDAPNKFGDRVKDMCFYDLENAEGVQCISQAKLYNLNEVGLYLAGLYMYTPEAEGAILRSHYDGFVPGSRSWGYQRHVPEPTVDLWITGFEEAVDQYGNGKNMVGRLIAEYKGHRIGIGPGKLTHAERTWLWANCREVYIPWQKDFRRLAKIKYKKDKSYLALRQPTWQCWRDDKDEADG